MKVSEYFAQGERYFSESAREFMQVEEMAPQYAKNAWGKLHREFGKEFEGTVLESALLAKIEPRRPSISTTLQKFGKAVVYVGDGGMKESTARSRLRAAGCTKTHKKGDWIEGWHEDDTVVRVNRKRR